MSDQEDDDYKVGYGCPPKATRFKKGRSGNPSGRPKKKQNAEDLMERELAQPVRLTSGDVITVREAIIKAALRDLAQGKLKQWLAVIDVLKLYDAKPEFTPSGKDEALLQKAFKEMADRPDLLDQDVS